MVTKVSSALINTAGNIAYTAPNVSLGSISNLHISGGSDGQFLQTDGNGNLSFATSTGITTGKSIAMAIVFGF